MASWDDVRRIALSLPEAVERPTRGCAAWWVNGRMFAWDRPLRRSDLEALGAGAPSGPVLAARVPDEGIKRALTTEAADVYFTVPHLDGYAAVLVRLDRIAGPELTDLLVEAWLDRAPKRLTDAYLRAHD